MDCCILHSRQYRAVYERLVNSMSAAGMDRQFLSALRQRQRNELCTCSAHISAKVSPPLPCAPLTPLPETSSQQGNEMSSGPEVLEDAITRSLVDKIIPSHDFQAIVAAAQAHLTQLAEKRGQLAQLQPAIARLASLLDGTIEVSCKGWRVRQQRRYRKPRRTNMTACKSYRPQMPYARLRWPPLAVTTSLLQGQRNLPVQSPVPQTGEQSERCKVYCNQLQALSKNPHGWSSSVLDDDLLDIAEQFEDKLRVRRVARYIGRYRGSGCSSTASMDSARAHSDGSKAKKQNSTVVSIGDDHTKKSSRNTSTTTTSTDIVAASTTTCAIANRPHIDQRSRQPNHHFAFRGITEVTMRDMAQVWPYL